MIDLLWQIWYNKHNKANRENTYLHFVNICIALCLKRL